TPAATRARTGSRWETRGARVGPRPSDVDGSASVVRAGIQPDGVYLHRPALAPGGGSLAGQRIGLVLRARRPRSRGVARRRVGERVARLVGLERIALVE